MSVILCPEGTTLTLNIFLISAKELEVKLSVENLPGVADMLKQVDVEQLVKTYRLDEAGTGWRVMTRPEIADYVKREEAGDL